MNNVSQVSAAWPAAPHLQISEVQESSFEVSRDAGAFVYLLLIPSSINWREICC